MFPILETHLKQRISNYLRLVMKDNVKAREQHQDGKYYYVNHSHPNIDSQSILAKDNYPCESTIDDKRDKKRQATFKRIQAFFKKG